MLSIFKSMFIFDKDQAARERDQHRENEQEEKQSLLQEFYILINLRKALQLFKNLFKLNNAPIYAERSK